MMLRLQLYDAQLRSLSQAAGDHGPLPDDAMQGYAVADGDDTDAADTDAQEAESTAAEEPGPEIELVDAELLPARAWAAAVSQRMEDALDRFELGEADLNALMAELEGLRAVRDALPGLWPAEGRFTSGFGWRRDPVRGTTKFHSGIDIANDRGTAIYSVAPGTVTRAGTSSGYGRVVEIDHGFGVSTKYAHCTTLRVREGERVERGDYIATMGSTGKSTGPHLHFELRIDGNAVDPLKYLPR
jgi:murein DD-endopeptidase MepM/ murein hydrolase activator NlpD